MNSDQKLVAWMVLVLIGLVAWTTYRPWLKAVIFTPTQSQTDSGGLPGWIDPFGLLPKPNPFGFPGLLDYHGSTTGTAAGGLPMTTPLVA